MSDRINLSIEISWKSPTGVNGQCYKWGDSPKNLFDLSLKKTHVIYRWVRASDSLTAVIGETRRSLGARLTNYLNGGSPSAGVTNNRVYSEQKKLSENNDHLFLEFIETINGYDLSKNSQRKFLESILSLYYKPYMQYEL